MQVISSKDNEQIKYIKKLKDKKFRDETNEYIVEGIKLVREAIEEAVNIKTIVVCEDCEYTESFEQSLSTSTYFKAIWCICFFYT